MSFLSDFSLQSSEFSGQHGLEDTTPTIPHMEELAQLVTLYQLVQHHRVGGR